MSDERAQPPEEPLAQLEGYLRFIDILPDRANARVGRYIDPLTGERRQFRYDNLVALADLHHLQKELGSVPTSNDLKEHGKISLSVYRDRFGSYPRALEAAGFDPVFVDAQEKARYLREYEELVDPDEHSL